MQKLGRGGKNEWDAQSCFVFICNALLPRHQQYIPNSSETTRRAKGQVMLLLDNDKRISNHLQYCQARIKAYSLCTDQISTTKSQYCLCSEPHKFLP